jgi:hypothetical protein
MLIEPKRGAHGTGRSPWTVALVLVLGACGPAIAGEHEAPDPGTPHFIRRMSPAGGWHPDDGGLWHWWNPHCFPCWSGPDDYCRKPPPKVCWPPYPPYYLRVPMEVGDSFRHGAEGHGPRHD